MPLCFCQSFVSSFSTSFCLLDNVRTPEPSVFKFLSEINHGHGKMPIVFKKDPNRIKDGGVFVLHNPVHTLNDTVSGFMQCHNHTLFRSISYDADNFFIINITL